MSETAFDNIDMMKFEIKETPEVIADKELLTKFEQFIGELNLTNSNLDKQKILEKWFESDFSNDLCTLLNYIFSYKIKFYVKSANVLKNKHLVAENKYLSLFSLLSDLSNRKITGHTAISSINSYIKDRFEFKDTILKIIDKKINGRIDTKSINKVKDFIPTFDVALGEKFEEKIFNWEQDDWYVSRKLDGCRVIVRPDLQSCFSRQGEQYNTLDKLIDIIKNIPELQGYVLDGEVSLINDDNTDDFQGLMKEIRRKDHTISNIRLNIFDIMLVEDFENKTSNTTFSQRYEVLKQIEDKITSSHIKVLQQEKITSQELFDNWVKQSLDNNWEGLILRKDDFYKGKRSKDILKYKKFSDAEYEVVGINVGIKPMLIDGSMKDVDCLASVNIEHKGNIVQVGSGFSDQQRIDFYNDNSLIIGKIIKVKYFEESQDQNGNHSLRFPILVTIYEDGRFD